jgi:hypothetical protein
MITNSEGRAKKGGEIGLNGEHYKGGQFLPSSEKTVKGLIRIPKGSGKKEIAPYVYAYAPADDMLSIYDRIGHACRDNRKECQYVKGEGFIGLRLEVNESMIGHFGPAYMVKPTKENGWNDCETPFIPDPERLEWTKGLVDRFNNGERWYSLSEDPYHYLNQK